MKLQNNQTGQVENFCIDKDQICSCDRAFVYDSLAQLQEAGWEDYKEDKYYWYIDDMGVPSICSKHHDKTAKRKAFGNYFGTEEEAKKAVEKLEAWKRLEDKTNNKVENLEWCTHSENILHSFRVLGHRTVKGMVMNNKPVKCLDTGEIFASASEAARQKGCSQSNITKVILGERNKAGGLRWSYHFGSEE